jgi:DNA-binding LacI/PurR family transcriptional regulator
MAEAPVTVDNGVAERFPGRLSWRLRAFPGWGGFVPTMMDVAKRAGVALSTVSYTLNGTRPISEETRRRVLAAMEELGYQPHAFARGLASRRSKIIALLFPAPERGIGTTELDFVTGATNAARENGYSLILWPAKIHDPSEMRQVTDRGLVDGVVVLDVSLQDERVEMLQKTGFAFSLIGRCADSTGLSYVDIDFDQTLNETIGHLVGLGHRKIGFLNQSRSLFDAGLGPVVRSQASYEKVAAGAGLEAIMRFSASNPAAGREALAEMLEHHPDMTALVAMNDRAVPGVLQAAADAGLRIPEDFSLGLILSSAHVAEMMNPPLTVAELPGAELGRLGAELLIQQLEAEETEHPQILLPCPLVIRSSTGPLRRKGVRGLG